MIGIYKITSPSGKIYIGSSINIKNRLRNYKSLNCKAQPKIYNSLKKYGVDKHKFEIIIECTIDKLYELECYYGNLYNVLGENGLNLSLPNKDDKFKCTSIETITKMRKNNTGKSNPFYGKNHTYETKSKVSKTKKGFKMSIESRKNMCIAKQIANNKPEYKQKMRQLTKGDKNPFYGKSHSLNTIHKLREKKGRIILDTNTGIFYYGCKEASEMYGVSASCIEKYMNGKLKNKTSLILC